MAQSWQPQPSEVWSVSINMAPLKPAGATMQNGVVFSSRKGVTLTTTVSGANTAGSSTINLVDNPGAGARLTINGLNPTSELLKVSAVSGSGPYACTVIPVLRFTHNNAETVEYEQGENAFVLGSSVATADNDLAKFVFQFPIHGQTYRLSVRMPYSSGDVREYEVEAIAQDI